MAKKNQKIIAVSIMFSMFFLLACFGNAYAESQKTYKLRMQSIIPMGGIFLPKHFAEMVRKASGGRIDIQVFSDGEIVPAPEMLHAVGSKTIDLCETVSAMHSEISAGPMVGAPPFGWETMRDAMVFIEGYKDGRVLELLREEYAKTGAHLLGPTYGDPLGILAKKPLKTMKDIKGLKVETYDPGIAAFLKIVGIASSFIPPEEIYMALTTGVIDGSTMGGAQAFKDLALHEVAKYYHQPYLTGAASMAIVINKKLYDSMPADLQAILNISREAYAKWFAMQLHMNEVLLIDELGLELTPYGDELQAKMKAAAKKQWDDVAKSSPAAAEVVGLLKEWNQKIGR